MIHSARERVLRLLAGVRRPFDDQGDAHLLQRFVQDRDESAFAALLGRHSGLVWGTCRRVLGHEQDAEDVFQATFLVLAQQAAKIRKPEALVSWLHGTAQRLAQRAKRDMARRHNHEQRATRPAASEAPSELALRELQGLLDEEIDRLPAKYREVFTRSVLGGQEREEIARALGCEPGTIAVHLCRARKRLQQQLARRGVALGAALTAALAVTPSGAAPPQVVGAALRAVRGPLTAVTERVAALVLQGSKSAMFTTKQKALGALLVTATLLLAGAGAFSPQAPDGAQPVSLARAQPHPAGPSLPAKADKPASPPGYVIRLVKTDLQRELAPQNADVFVLVDGTKALEGGKAALGMLKLPELKRALMKDKKKGSKLHFTLFFLRPDADNAEQQDLLRYALIGFGHEIGFGRVTAYLSSAQRNTTWEDTARAFTGKADPVGSEERAIANKLVKAYPVRTGLSRYLSAGADCTVVILPSLRKEKGAIPKAVREAVADAVAKLKLPRKKRVTFVLGFVDGADGGQQRLVDALSKMGKELGFEASAVNFR